MGDKTKPESASFGTKNALLSIDMRANQADSLLGKKEKLFSALVFKV
jgi:hypothetical protein